MEQQQPNVLLAEDDQFLSSLLKTRLTREGIAVTQAFDGEQAVSLVQSLSPAPALILLDLIMPKLSGFEVLQTIRLHPDLAHIPVFVLTNLGQDEDIAKVKELGAQEYFVKVRSSIDDIVTRIKAYLQSPHS